MKILAQITPRHAVFNSPQQTQKTIFDLQQILAWVSENILLLTLQIRIIRTSSCSAFRSVANPCFAFQHRIWCQ